MKENQPITKRVDIIDQRVVYADTEELARQRAANRERIARERDYPMIQHDAFKPEGHKVKRRQGWHNAKGGI